MSKLESEISNKRPKVTRKRKTVAEVSKEKIYEEAYREVQAGKRRKDVAIKFGLTKSTLQK